MTNPLRVLFGLAACAAALVLVPSVSHAGTSTVECSADGLVSLVTGDPLVTGSRDWTWQATDVTVNGAPVAVTSRDDGPGGSLRYIVAARPGDLIRYQVWLEHLIPLAWDLTLEDGTVLHAGEHWHPSVGFRSYEAPACVTPATSTTVQATTTTVTATTSTVATSSTSTTVADTTVTVTPQATTTTLVPPYTPTTIVPPELPQTGKDTSLLTAVALLLIAAGTVLIIATRPEES